VLSPAHNPPPEKQGERNSAKSSRPQSWFILKTDTENGVENPRVDRDGPERRLEDVPRFGATDRCVCWRADRLAAGFGQIVASKNAVPV
jgi:hypothetical protein